MLRDAHRPDVDAEPVVDPVAVTERELRAPAAGLEDDERAVDRAEAGDRGEVREPRLLLAVDHLDLDAAALAHSGHELVGVVGRTHPRGARGDDFVHPVRTGLVDHLRDRVGRPPDRFGIEPVRRRQPLAEACHLGPVDEVSPRSVRRSFAEDELHRVRPHVDHGMSAHAEPEEQGEAAREADVRPRPQPERLHGRAHDSRILVLDGDGARRPRPRPHVRELRHAAVEEVVDTVLGDGNCEQFVVGRDDLLDQLVEVVRVAVEGGHGHVQRPEERGDIGRIQRELRLRDGPPLLEPLVVDLLEPLDVELPTADLDASLDPAREDVQLVAVFHFGGLKRRQARLGLAERVAERPPLPAGDDHRSERRAATLMGQPSTMPSAAAEGAGSGSRIMRNALTTPTSDARSATRSAT